MSRYRFQISARILTWPRMCACCGRPSDTTMRASACKSSGKRVVTATTSWWEVPHCSECVQHVERYQKAVEFNALGAVLAIASLVAVSWLAKSLLVGFVLAICAIIVCSTLAHRAKHAAGSMTTHDCCSVGPAVEYLGWYGTFHEFMFSNQKYLNAFLGANHRKTQSNVSVMP
jgi:hypothetical protein